MQAGMGTQAIKGATWSIAAKFSRQFIQFFTQILLARILTPEDFGVFSLLIVFGSFAEVIRNMGLGSALIYKRNFDPEYLNTVFFSNMALSVLLYLLIFISAPLLAQFFSIPRLGPYLRTYSLIFLVGGFNVVQITLLQDKLAFKKLFLIDSVAVIIGGLLAYLLAMKGFGVYTLIFQYLAITLLSSVFLWFLSDWKPSLVFSWPAFRELNKFGTSLLMNDFLVVISRNIDNLIIGKWIGSQQLGIYSRAYFLMLQPLNITHQVLDRVMFPVLSKCQGNLSQMSELYLKATKMLAFVALPCFAVVLVFTKEIIQVLLGDQWTQVATILRIFCIYGIVDTLGLSSAWLYKATGNTPKLLRWTIYNSAVIISAIFLGMNWGIEGVAWAYSLSFLIFLWLPGWIRAFRLINLRLQDMFANIMGAFLASVLLALFLYLLRFYWLKGLSSIGILLVVATTSPALYGLLSYLLNREALFLFVKKTREIVGFKKRQHAGY